MRKEQAQSVRKQYLERLVASQEAAVKAAADALKKKKIAVRKAYLDGLAAYMAKEIWTRVWSWSDEEKGGPTAVPKKKGATAGRKRAGPAAVGRMTWTNKSQVLNSRTKGDLSFGRLVHILLITGRSWEDLPALPTPRHREQIAAPAVKKVMGLTDDEYQCLRAMAGNIWKWLDFHLAYKDPGGSPERLEEISRKNPTPSLIATVARNELGRAPELRRPAGGVARPGDPGAWARALVGLYDKKWPEFCAIVPWFLPKNDRDRWLKGDPD